VRGSPQHKHSDNRVPLTHPLTLTPAAFLMIGEGSQARRDTPIPVKFPLSPPLHPLHLRVVVVHGNGKLSCRATRRRFSPSLGDPGTLRREEGCASSGGRKMAGVNRGPVRKVKRARRTNSLRGSMCGDSTVHEALLLPGGAAVLKPRGARLGEHPTCYTRISPAADAVIIHSTAPDAHFGYPSRSGFTSCGMS
jgi:hypothetical protein